MILQPSLFYWCGNLGRSRTSGLIVDFVNFFLGDRVNIVDTAHFPDYTIFI